MNIVAQRGPCTTHWATNYLGEYPTIRQLPASHGEGKTCLHGPGDGECTNVAAADLETGYHMATLSVRIRCRQHPRQVLGDRRLLLYPPEGQLLLNPSHPSEMLYIQPEGQPAACSTSRTIGVGVMFSQNQHVC
ncbi:uncharacterized protein N7482_006971 [Penicillium canariense]|uniref:Uncharacterized protein n=1 Tax=Penicillium canariense TaxID=189055 RepID=A0A9W9HVX8_9EURO|nr:uncharacterized protein N7482_006971 [Penicillium canariense]KAJ5159967.1 hypothetical protein N7482_006971 [Penicillium canariense]